MDEKEISKARKDIVTAVKTTLGDTYRTTVDGDMGIDVVYALDECAEPVLRVESLFSSPEMWEVEIYTRDEFMDTAIQIKNAVEDVDGPSIDVTLCEM